ncbi:RINT1-like protein MAG2L [Durio zibethinus]|uniref:RINT1-like protein MAG2L n=1 Tax=Durio zibethinus TaxID=66656 RepID=A0A6P5Y7K4_DURZI|nr:RINT1-like protein MAG2L [Durio zibethinus]
MRIERVMEEWHHQKLILPKVGKLWRQQSEYLDQHFKTPNDVSPSSTPCSCLLSELTKHCSDLDTCLLHLRTILIERALSWISRSFHAKASLANLNLNLTLYASSPDGTASQRMQQRILGEELQQLVLQLQRIHSVRQYLETALCLEALVGDLEDAVFCSGNHCTGNMFTKLSTTLTSQDFGQKQERLLRAIKAINDIEEIIVNVEKSQQQWHQLLQSVDHRVDKILSVIRPEALAEHRALLASLGWPPKLLTSKVESGAVAELPNPLVLIHGDEKKSYAQSFQVLCALQQLQTRREVRKITTLDQKEYGIRLWAIDELVSPLAERMEYHFLKWAEQPEFIFALAYRVTRGFMVGVTDILQPLIDAARLLGYSANEAWVSAMVHMLSGFLTENVFPALAERYKEKDMKLEVISLWLHLVDLIVGFDKRMQSLVRSETCLFLPDAQRYDGLSRGISVLKIFCDRPDWLKIWAKMELKDGWKKLKAVLKDAKAWQVDDTHRIDFNVSKACETFLLSSREDHKAPLVAESALKIAQEMIDRSQTLPTVLARVQFVTSTVARFFWHFSNVLLLHCKNAELSAENSDDSASVRACESINAARYVESKLQEWSDDVRFFEMKITEKDSNILEKGKGFDDGCFFVEEIKRLSELETNWLMEIIAFLLRQFENQTWGYNHNEDYIDEDQNMSPNRDSAATELAASNAFIEALHTLRNQLYVLKINLNPKDFLDLWRSVAEGLDHFISGSIFASDAQFSRKQTNQFGTDMRALFLVFQPFCARPEAFFPCIRDILKLLTMSKEGAKQLLVASSSKKSEKRMQFYGSCHLSSDQVNKVLRNMKL